MYPFGRGGTGGTAFSGAALSCDATDPSLPLRPGNLPGVEEGVVAEVGSESLELGVPVKLLDEDDSRLSTLRSADLRAIAAGTAGTSSPRSSQLFKGDSFSPTLPVLALLSFRSLLVGVFRGGVPDLLVIELAPVDNFCLPLPFPGVLPNPSSFLNASAVSASTSRDQLPAFKVFCESAAGIEPRLSRTGWVKYEAEGLKLGGV
jgi:hypothetical protein